MNKKPAVYIVDDDPGIRKSLTMLMDSASINSAAFESAEQFLAEADLNCPAVLLLDLRMEGMSGLDLLKSLRERGERIPSIIMTGNADIPSVVGSMKLGAIDVLVKPVEPTTLLETVKGTLQTAHDLRYGKLEHEAIRARFSRLTPRERTLLRMLVSGQSNKQIAFDLNISAKTVANHRASLMEKLGAVNAADMARLTVLSGILTEPEKSH